MKRTTSQILLSALLTIVTGCAASKPTLPPPVMDKTASQLVFSSPEQALSALTEATETHDKAKLASIFGPRIKDLLNNGDAVQDENRFKLFAELLKAKSELVPLFPPAEKGTEPNSLVLVVGPENFPFPVPLVKGVTGWRFDSVAGVREIHNRRIGENELVVIGLCHDFPVAEYDYILGQFAERDAGAKIDPQFASKFVSTPGKHDGLFWEAKQGEKASPLGPLVATATDEGYKLPNASAPTPFHGYFFRILTKQSANARGGAMNYVKNGKMTEGFAMIAYPAAWNESGIMTFIVGSDGVVYQKNLGPKTSELVKKITSFDPDMSWDPANT